MANWTRVQGATSYEFVDLDKAISVSVDLAVPESSEPFKLLIRLTADYARYTEDTYASGASAYADLLKLINVTKWKTSEED